METNKMEDTELIARIERAARDGAREGVLEELKQLPTEKASGARVVTRFATKLVILIILIALAAFLISSILPALNPFNKIKEQLGFENPALNHDLVISDSGLLGYTAADFADAILSDQKQLKKIEVFSTEVSEATTITDAGLLKIKLFSKSQVITYNGTATYVVDLSGISRDDIELDKDTLTVKLYIPHAQRSSLDLPSDKVMFADAENGLLAIGKIKLSAEEQNQIRTEAENKMKEKLEEDNILDEADRFAKLTVWELFQPVIAEAGKGFTLEVDFRE